MGGTRGGETGEINVTSQRIRRTCRAPAPRNRPAALASFPVGFRRFSSLSVGSPPPSPVPPPPPTTPPAALASFPVGFRRFSSLPVGSPPPSRVPQTPHPTAKEALMSDTPPAPRAQELFLESFRQSPTGPAPADWPTPG